MKVEDIYYKMGVVNEYVQRKLLRVWKFRLRDRDLSSWKVFKKNL